MNENRYSLAGWLAITQAILFPLSFVIGIVQAIVGARAFGIQGPVPGPADLIGVIMTIIGVYVLVMFRRLLQERFDFHEIDMLITVAIWWLVVFQIGGLGLKLLLFAMPYEPILQAVLSVSFFAIAMVTIGVIDILVAVRLLKIKEQMSDSLLAYVYLTMAAGIAEVSVVLSFLSLIIFPVASVILGIVFFKEKEQAEFV